VCLFFYQMDGEGPDTIVVLHGGACLNLEGPRPDLRALARHLSIPEGPVT
jgi:hypothetical protein